jgi:hypothetical protein
MSQDPTHVGDEEAKHWHPMKVISVIKSGQGPPVLVGEEAAVGFIEEFVKALASNDLNTQLGYYADRVDYYDMRQVTKQVIRKDLEHDGYSERFAAQVWRIPPYPYELFLKISKTPINIDHSKLLELGRARFQRLLELDKDLRTEQRVIQTGTDVSSFESVRHVFATASALTTTVPRSRTKDFQSGNAAAKDRARQVDSWAQLWKISSEPLIVRKLYPHHDAWESPASCEDSSINR